MNDQKSEVQAFWNKASCGEELYFTGSSLKAAYENQANSRYSLEPYIIDFAQFEKSNGKKVLEIGVGLGADHQQFAKAGAQLYGIDLTERAIKNTAERLALFGLHSELALGDAEKLSFDDGFFDIVYSWGVIHHSPDTQSAVNEIYRVLKPGGQAMIMIYHTYSIVGYLLWLRYGLLSFKPFKSLKEIYHSYLESQGTKAYSSIEARNMFSKFSKIDINTVLTHGDLLTSEAGQRHRGMLLTVAKKIFPRFLVRKLLSGHGLFMLIRAQK